MNDETRAALVQQIADRIDTFCEHVGYGDPDVTRDEAASYVEQIEEALLTDRAPVDDADQVEAAAKAMFSADCPFVWQAQSGDTQGRYRNMARAAAGAAPSLDAALDDIGMNVVAVNRVDAGWLADMSYDDGHVVGRAGSFTDAIADAVAKARAQQKETTND